MNPRARAEQVIRRVRRYGDTKRGPYLLNYFVNDAGNLKIEATDGGQFFTAGELLAPELIGDEGIAKATDLIEKLLARTREYFAKVRVVA